MQLLSSDVNFKILLADGGDVVQNCPFFQSTSELPLFSITGTCYLSVMIKFGNLEIIFGFSNPKLDSSDEEMRN